MMICPHCGKEIQPKRQKGLPEHPGPVATDRQIYAYYKAIGPTEDLRWIQRHASPALCAEIDSLLSGTPTAKDAARMREKRRIELAHAGKPAVSAEMAEARFWRLVRLQGGQLIGARGWLHNNRPVIWPLVGPYPPAARLPE